jgi:hypothetical protein
MYHTVPFLDATYNTTTIYRNKNKSKTLPARSHVDPHGCEM